MADQRTIGQSFTRFHRVVEPRQHQPEHSFEALSQRRIPTTLHDFTESAKHYRPSDELEIAVNMALSVGAPLLLTGEPGTGKTQVAYHLAWFFGIKLYPFQVRSTSSAQEVMYEFDAVGYLREAYREQQGIQGAERVTFLHSRALWDAYKDPRPSVVLIDEIDKAPRDFPNDLLHELDKHSFDHPLTHEPVRPESGQPPIVVVTSNAERRLPDAFLRRCIVHHIELTERLVRDATHARSGTDFPHLSPDTLTASLERFWELRDREDLTKRPGTAELLAWLAILSAREMTAADVEGRPLIDLPALGALIKDHEDLSKL